MKALTKAEHDAEVERTGRPISQPYRVLRRRLSGHAPDGRKVTALTVGTPSDR